MAFRGFPADAITFYEGLEADNSKTYWAANKAVYEASIKGPMTELIESVPERFRPLRMFRPNRDVRFSSDKSPYKTNIGAVGEREGGAVYYVAFSAKGMYCGSGYYDMASDQLERFRAAIDDAGTGEEIAGIVATITKAGYTATAINELKTAPKGYAKDHPRIDLLRRKGLVIGRDFPVGPWLHTAKAKDRVVKTWTAADPLNDWLDRNVGPSELPPDDRWTR